jgi:hypothetical protein
MTTPTCSSEYKRLVNFQGENSFSCTLSGLLFSLDYSFGRCPKLLPFPLWGISILKNIPFPLVGVITNKD